MYMRKLIFAGFLLSSTFNIFCSEKADIDFAISVEHLDFDKKVKSIPRLVQLVKKPNLKLKIAALGALAAVVQTKQQIAGDNLYTFVYDDAAQKRLKRIPLKSIKSIEAVVNRVIFHKVDFAAESAFDVVRTYNIRSQRVLAKLKKLLKRSDIHTSKKNRIKSFLRGDNSFW